MVIRFFKIGDFCWMTLGQKNKPTLPEIHHFDIIEGLIVFILDYGESYFAKSQDTNEMPHKNNLQEQ